MPKLGVPIRGFPAFLQFPIALQTVVLFVQQLGDSHIAGGMSLAAQFGGQGARALADPPQGRFGIATGATLNQLVERGHQTRIRPREVFASGPRDDGSARPAPSRLPQSPPCPW